MTLMYNGNPVLGPRGPAGPDGNPIGTIISYMGLKAPTDYLICDGSIYNISDYSKLAEFFKTQFGSESYFGGDGTTTFAVPDLRNLFLRGFHGSSEEQLSGDVGVKQDGTWSPSVASTTSSAGNEYYITPTFLKSASADNMPKNYDKMHKAQIIASVIASGLTDVTVPPYNNSIYPYEHTSRPVNMAVLYCIKATIAEPKMDLYSEEEIRVGTWIDGKPLYQLTFIATIDAANTTTKLIKVPNIDQLVNANMVSFRGDSYYKYIVPLKWLEIGCKDDYIVADIGTATLVGKPSTYTIKYTKTTDQGVST